jgi:hypothetical protein
LKGNRRATEAVSGDAGFLILSVLMDYRSAVAAIGHSLGIVMMCIAAAVGYGIIHDQITARICVEYFTVGHPPVFGTENPTLLGLGWGIIATWWVGLLLGVLLAQAARAGSRPQRSAMSLWRPILGLLAVMAICAAAAGMFGWMLASIGAVHLVGPITQRLPAERHIPFLADLWAHSASYLVGLAGSVIVMVLVWRSRGQAALDCATRNDVLEQSASTPSGVFPRRH